MILINHVLSLKMLITYLQFNFTCLSKKNLDLAFYLLSNLVLAIISLFAFSGCPFEWRLFWSVEDLEIQKWTLWSALAPRLPLLHCTRSSRAFVLHFFAKKHWPSYSSVQLFSGCPTQHCCQHQKKNSHFGPTLRVNMKKAKWQLFGATSFIHNLYTQRYSLRTRLRLFCPFIKPQRPCFYCLSCPSHNLNWSPAQPSWWRLGSEHSCETSQPTRHLFRDLNRISPSPRASCSKAAIQGPPKRAAKATELPVWARPGAKIVKLLCLF